MRGTGVPLGLLQGRRAGGSPGQTRASLFALVRVEDGVGHQVVLFFAGANHTPESMNALT